MSTTYLILLILFLTANATRFAYELLKKAGRIDPRRKGLFLLILLVMCVLWLSWFAMCSQDPLDLALPISVRGIGMGIFIAGLVLALAALFQLRGVENIDHLVTGGLFSKLRHPMYLGFVCWIFGWATYHSAGMSLVAGLIAIGNIAYWRHLEEVHLLETYGDRYLAYRGQTWF